MTGVWQFKIDGILRGYIGTYARPWTVQAKNYVKWKEYVRIMASAAGLPFGVESHETAKLTMTFTYKKRARIDSVNVYKGIEDALFKKDRRVLAGEFSSVENTGYPETATVTLEIR